MSANGNESQFVVLKLPMEAISENPSGKPLLNLNNLDSQLDFSQISSEQQQIVKKLFARGMLSDLSPQERLSIADLKVELSTSLPYGEEVALIVRFDWTWVKIDRAPLNYDDLNGLPFNL